MTDKTLAHVGLTKTDVMRLANKFANRSATYSEPERKPAIRHNGATEKILWMLREGPMPSRLITARLGMPQGSISGILASLMARGEVKRCGFSVNERGRRDVAYGLTEDAKRNRE